MTKIIVASGNKGKIKEAKEILSSFEVLSIKEIGIDIDVEEDRDTFKGNAMKKAEEIAKVLKDNSLVLADDSGIEVDYLGGKPGVYSKRWFEGTDHDRNMHILDLLKGVPKEKRIITFKCAIAVSDGNNTIVEEGELHGYVSESPRGDNGFGFDEIFELESGKTLAELSDAEKNEISSRKIALEKVNKRLETEFIK